MKRLGVFAALAIGLCLAVLPAKAATNQGEIAMQTVDLTLDQVFPYGHNPRRNEAAIDGVMESISQFGFLQPLVVDTDHVIIVGHTRYEALKRLGFEKVTAIVADLTDEQAKQYRIADNKSGEEADWDFDLLRSELRELELSGADLAPTGFSETELAKLMSAFDPEPETEGQGAVLEDGIRCEAGDVWELGNHQMRVGRNCLGECDAMITGWQEATGKAAKLMKSRKAIVAKRNS